ncbi:lipocalin family protein [Chryseobacterium capnotolerans]|uniref:lipocalin family protein n=1 Tax=Chryseobacterium TaxID=59732 RepID=UPI00083B2822|nr:MULTISPECIES: lipocalin family protein [Chryseobacterium]UHO39774.1 lipocalin family protein [Chryseobacterium capnotolerans]
MKKIVAGILISGSFISCTLGDDTPKGSIPDPVYDTNIVGIWKIQIQYIISGDNKETILKETPPDDCKKKSTYEFRNNGKYYMADYNSISSECVMKEATLPYLYNPAHMKLTINNNESEVLEITANKLTILAADNSDYNGDGTKDYIKTIFYK